MKQSSIFFYVKRNSSNSEGVDSIEQEAPFSKRTKCNKTAKVRKWDKTYLKYGFFLPDDQIPNVARDFLILPWFQLSYKGIWKPTVLRTRQRLSHSLNI